MAREPLRFELRGDHITLGQLLKAIDVVRSGGEVKSLLERGGILVNGEEDNRRGRKLRVGDVVRLKSGAEIEIVN